MATIGFNDTGIIRDQLTDLRLRIHKDTNILPNESQITKILITHALKTLPYERILKEVKK